MSGYSSYELQEYDYYEEEWVTQSDYPADSRAEGNAWYAVRSLRACRDVPIRLLKDGEPILADNPETFYNQEDG